MAKPDGQHSTHIQKEKPRAESERQPADAPGPPARPADEPASATWGDWVGLLALLVMFVFFVLVALFDLLHGLFRG